MSIKGSERCKNGCENVRIKKRSFGKSKNDISHSGNAASCNYRSRASVF